MTARRHSPVTGTNWQGTGVIPDTPVLADEAYHVVYARALRHVVELGDAPPIADEVRDARATLSGLISALSTDPRALCNPPGQRTAGEQPPVARVWARAPQYRPSASCIRFAYPRPRSPSARRASANGRSSQARWSASP